MIEIPTGSFHRIDILVTKDDVSTAPDSTPEYEIIDTATGDTLSSGVAEVSDEPAIFYIPVGPSITSVDRLIKCTWTYEIDSMPYQGFEYTQIVTVYAETGEIITELGLGDDPTDIGYMPQAKLRSAERLSRMQINNYTGRKFAPSSGTQEAFGFGTDTILFPERIISFTKIEQDDVLVYDSEQGINLFGFDIVITDTRQGIRITNSSQLDVLVSTPNSTTYTPRVKFIDGARYKITGVFGYEYVPIEVKQAAFLLINDHLYNDALWRERYVESFDTGQMKMKFRDSAFTGTGNLIVDDLLDTYKITGIVVI